jgi:hydrogenase expression/formation protein HypC
MCIGLPMCVTDIEPGHAWCAGRGELRRVSTALVGAVAVGDWLLVFLGDAREAIGAERAAEVNAALDMVFGALSGGGSGEAGFVLPSMTTAEELRRVHPSVTHPPLVPEFP